MGIAFGLFILIVVVIALFNRRREKKAWLSEERYDESGDWLDKRPGERGAYGRLDALQEAERHAISRQGKVNDLVLVIRNHHFEYVPGFSGLGNDQLKRYSAFARDQIGRMLTAMDALKKGVVPEIAADTGSEHSQQPTIRKMLLDFAYRQAPELLDIDLERIKALDRYAGMLAGILLDKAEALVREP